VVAPTSPAAAAAQDRPPPQVAAPPVVAAPPAAAPAPAIPPAAPPAAAPPATVMLLLPSQSTAFARAAEVVRQGFAAAQAAAAQPMTVRLVEVEDDPQQLLRAMSTARERGVDVIAGPLTRSQVSAALRASPSVPMVTLSLPESEAGAPPSLLAFGLSIEQEARAMVQAVVATLMPARPGAPTRLNPRFVLLTGESTLSRRAGAAFRDALRSAGERVTAFTVEMKYEALQSLGDRVFRAEPEGVFLALDAREAAIVRPRLPHDVPLFATSLVNLGGGESALLANDLEGVHFVDVPWLLEADHPAVMVYARSAQPLSAELQRLYALGIDAYRLADAWRSGAVRFGLDGVTGDLQVDRARDARVERWPAFAVFRKGVIERIAVPRPGAPH
jgi:outer membrane PBP1 activator LpoA protein